LPRPDILVCVICADCGRTVKRVCRDCQAVRARNGMLMHQRRFLQTWAASAIDMRVRDFDGTTHLELFDDPWHAYCGAALPVATGRRRVRTLPADLCTDCRAMLDQLLARYVTATDAPPSPNAPRVSARR
jgi:hypothetical protein